MPAIWTSRPHAAQAALLCAFLLAAGPAAAEWAFTAGAALRHNNNPGNAELDADKVPDTSAGATASATQLYVLDNADNLMWSANFGTESYNRLSGLDNVSLGASVALRHKWGLGPFAPWTRVSLSTTRFSYNNDIRDGWLRRAAIGAGQRVGERWNLWAEYEFDRRSAASQPRLVPGLSGDVFSQRNHQLSANAEYLWNDDATLNFGLWRRSGDFVSTTRRHFQIFRASTALAEDEAFGPEMYAYALTGSSFGLRLGVSYTISPHALLTVELLRQLTRANGGNDYASSVPSVSWDYSF